MALSSPETRASLILRLPNSADIAAWDEFVAIYGPLVYRLALQRHLQPADADELVQEVFSAIARQIGEWVERPDRGSFRAWLLRIARNIAVNLLTRKPRGATGGGGEEWARLLAEIPAPESESSQFDLEYQREVIHWAAEQVRGRVAEKTWSAFHLTHIEGMSIEDAAQQLGMTVGNVYIARSRIVSRLRTIAQQFEVQDD